jgi:hypothetical protein
VESKSHAISVARLGYIDGHTLARFWFSSPIRGGNFCVFAPVTTFAAISPMKRVSDGSARSYDFDELVHEAEVL